MFTHMRSMDVGRYRYIYEDFYEKFISQMFINKGRMTIAQGLMKASWEFSSFFSVSLGEEL